MLEEQTFWVKAMELHIKFTVSVSNRLCVLIHHQNSRSMAELELRRNKLCILLHNWCLLPSINLFHPFTFSLFSHLCFTVWHMHLFTYIDILLTSFHIWDRTCGFFFFFFCDGRTSPSIIYSEFIDSFLHMFLLHFSLQLSHTHTHTLCYPFIYSCTTSLIPVLCSSNKAAMNIGGANTTIGVWSFLGIYA